MAFNESTCDCSRSLKPRPEVPLPCMAAFELGDLVGDRHHDRFTDVDLADLRDSAL
jgi:hypothetical protein